MKAICFYFQVHQPLRLRNYRFFEMGLAHNYYDDYQNKYLVNRIADRCYIPMNEIIGELIETYGKKFKVSFSISGVALEQFEWYAPHVIESFKKLAKTGNVEFLAETYGHSLASITDTEEFKNQVKKHSDKIYKLFGQKPKTFRNTELIYSDEIGDTVQKMGFDTMLTEGAKHILGWKSPNYLYCNAQNKKLNLLLRNYQLSDDISFRFSNQSWEGWPLTTEKYVDWILALGEKEDVINLFMDYETFGEHQWKESGIFDFFKALPREIFNRTAYTFSTPSEIVKKLKPVSPLHIPYPISWADEERDLTAWLGNELQNEAFEKLYELADLVRKNKDPEIQKDWLFLQCSDHFYYMCTKWLASADVHKHFSHYPSPYEAFINYMNILSDFIIRLKLNQKTTLNKIITNPKKENMETKKPAAKKTAAKKPAVKKATKPAAKKAAAKPAAKKAAAKPAAKKPAVKKAVAAKPAAKKAVAKKPAVKKAAAAKPAAKKAVAKKPAVKKAVAKKPAVKKAAAKPAVKKAVAKKPAVKKAAAKKPAVKKAAAKPAVKKAVAKKPAVKKAAAKKPAAKKATK